MKYSIITPQYNSFSLMGDYFNSLQNQTYKDFEVIIVDDCSTDGSFEKLKDYSKHCGLDIKVFRSDSNKGPGNARNIGIEKATGDWITFVDNDDWVEDTLLQQIDRIIEEESVNCIIYDYYTWLDGKTSIAHSMYVNKLGRKTISECMFLIRNHTFGKFYKKSECGNIRFPEIRRCEDVAYVTQAVVACGDVYYYNEPLYYYRQRPTSLSNNKKMDHTDMVKAFAVLEEKFLKSYPYEIRNKSVPDILYGGLLMMCKSGKDSEDILKYILEYEKKYPEWWNCEITNYLGMAKKLFLMCVRMRFITGLKIIAFFHSLMIKQGA